ncbi:DEAD/DEAH box helicase family protein, partial [Candidatus Woesearchaeota archaeon]|nr:DEAD/DEAH box helicase family protein [Candidatus Woesearchaeota archaeon]
MKKENNILWESTGSGKTYVMAQTIANLKGIQKNIDK